MKQIFLTLLILSCSILGNAQNISKSQATADIDTLLYMLSEVHPNLYSNISICSLNSQIADIKSELQDSISTLELYGKLAPVVAQIGDAHTSIVLPYRDVMIKAGKYIPVFPTIDNNTGRMYVKASVGNAVPYDSEILSINGVSAADMVSKMRTYVSGEREFYRLTIIDNNIMGLFHMLFASSEYDISYREPNGKQNKNITLQAVDAEKLNSQLVLSPKILKLMEEHSGNAPYSFRISDDKRAAIMNFDVCQDVKGMEQFADSMFAQLHKEGIKNLIIDVSFNGGGNSNVGDVLLKHIAPKPFAQYGTTYVRVTPVTQSLTGNRYQTAGIFFYPEDASSRHEPHPVSQRFDGNVYLLTSHTTFSSASSFAWAFQEAGCGTIIGEETGGMSVHYGDVITFTLPHSSLSVNVSHKRFWLPGADENNIHGVIPNIICPQQDALQRALKYIEAKNE